LIVRARTTVIRRRWWAHLLNLVVTTGLLCLCTAIAAALLTMSQLPASWPKALLLTLASAVFLLGGIVGLNALFTYRVEIDARGLRIIGNLYTHDLHWDEIASIRKRSNFRAPGYHVEIQVDGSRNSRRHWCNLWLAGYFVHPGMEKGGIALAAWLNRKQREYTKRARAISPDGPEQGAQ
jgi:hypothetical protein